MGQRVGVRGGFENLPIPSLNPTLEPEEEYVQFNPPHFMSDSGRPFTSDIINPASHLRNYHLQSPYRELKLS